MPQGDGMGPPGWGRRRQGRGCRRRARLVSDLRHTMEPGPCDSRGRQTGSPAAPLPSPGAPDGGVKPAGEPRRQIARVDAAKCIRCGACEDICPRGAITAMDPVNVDPKKCSGCGACVRVCPSAAIRLN